MARYVNRSDRYHVQAAAIYDAEGMDACMTYLHGLVRSRKISAAQATHIICWTAPDDVLAAYQASRKEAAE